MGPEQRQNIERLCQEKRIVFDRDALETDWPENHHSVFSAIKALGQSTYGGYEADDQSSTALESPWKYEAKSSAQQLAHIAKQCVQRNEASWRFACEPLILGRFNAQIAWSVDPIRYSLCSLHARIESVADAPLLAHNIFPV